MQRCLFFILIVFCAVLTDAAAQGLDDQYVQVFSLIQEADSASQAHPSEALAKYLQAQAALQRIQRINPDWNSKIVTFRLSYVGSKISALSDRAVPPAKAEPTTQLSVRVPGAPEQAQPSAPADWESKMDALKEQVRQLQADKTILEAKLKEAFSARPAEADPGEFAKAREKVNALEKENELLKITVEKLKSATTPSADPRVLEQTQQALQEATRQLAEQKENTAKLSLEKKALQDRFTQLGATASSNTGSTPINPVDQKQNVKQLELQRDDLQRKLDAANKELSRRKEKNVPNQVRALQEELANVRARLDTYQAKATPYTPEELALFKAPVQTLPEMVSDSDRKPARPLSASAANLVAEARRYYQAGQFDKAEASYSQVLKEDQKNSMILADLASIQVEANHLDAAEANIKQALALKPDSVYCLSVMGRLRFKQTRYDEAIDSLSRASKLEPDNVEVQNFLGLALSEKGMRGPAEAALRKAVQLEPNYATAHNNLAVVYITQKPPAPELAKWHYQKALAAGSPRNLALEKLISEAK